MAASDTRSCMMVAEAAAQIVSQKLDVLLSHPVCVECLPMQACAKEAKAKLATIQEFISTQYRPSKPTEWWGRLLQAMYYAEEFIDKFHLREACERHKALHMAVWPLALLISKYRLRRDLSILVNKMEELCDEKFLKEQAEGKRKKESASSSSHASVPWQGKKLARLTSFWDQYVPIYFLCHEEEKRQIMERIREESSDIRGISICGQQGAGMTILARWVYGQAKYMDYERRAWVHISASMDKREFLSELLKQVDMLAREMKHMDIEEIKKMLFRKLVDTKRFLIVLDEVQPSNELLLRELAMSIPFSSRGHIITTTQDDKIAQFMDTSGKGPIRLQYLKDEESQKMLAWKLHGVRDRQKLSKEEKDILEKSGGSPLYISLLSGILSNAGEHERAAALVEEGSMMTLSDIRQLSYHKLPVHLKPCFIYMALFPVGSPVPTRRLVRLWLAEGLLDSHSYDIERERKRPPEDVGETFILELADRNVIHVVGRKADGSPKACRMLTPLYEMIRPIATSMGFVHIHATSESKDGNDRDPTSQQQQSPAQPRERTKIRWLAEHTNIVTDIRGSSYPDLNLRHIRSFLSFYLRRGMLTKDLSTFLRKMTSETHYSLLKVLDLEGVYKPSLQGVLRKLVLLRYLGLRSTVLDTLPSAVAHLHHLETLDIKHTNITSLPSSLWKARNLRHLHLNWFYIDLKKILKACRNNAMALAKLQTLSGLVIGDVKENAMTGHMNSLTTLTTLKLFLQHSVNDTPGAAGKTVADWISSRLTNLQSLTFGVIQEAKPAEEAQLEKRTADETEAEPAEEAQLVKRTTEEATKVAKLAKEAQPVKEDKATKKAKRAEGAYPATSKTGPLPELSLAEQHDDLLELYLLGQLNKPNWTKLLPVSLRVLTLSGSKVKTDVMPELGRLLRNLRTLRLLANSVLCQSMSFVKDGFPSLQILKIWKLPKLAKVNIEQGAVLHLKELEFRHLDSMEHVEGINECKELEHIFVVVKNGAQDFVDHLKKEIGHGVYLYKIEDTETPESMDEDEDEDEDDKRPNNWYFNRPRNGVRADAASPHPHVPHPRISLTGLPGVGIHWGLRGGYVIKAGRLCGRDEESNTVEFFEVVFGYVGLKRRDHVVIDKRYFRPAEVNNLQGDASKAKKVLGRKPKVGFEKLVKTMVDEDIELAKREKVLVDAGYMDAQRQP
ncbi:hypothetical protein NL676_006359 [Syzygium grande]|nr:hypothetical protein NL676_006359 [Syzygium grande]